jgi:hypothetical protein
VIIESCLIVGLERGLVRKKNKSKKTGQQSNRRTDSTSGEKKWQLSANQLLNSERAKGTKKTGNQFK